MKLLNKDFHEVLMSTFDELFPFWNADKDPSNLSKYLFLGVLGEARNFISLKARFPNAEKANKYLESLKEERETCISITSYSILSIEIQVLEKTISKISNEHNN